MGVVTISSKGQVAIPKEARDSLHIRAGDKFSVEVRGDSIVLKPVVTVPRDQAWFWTPEVQQKIRRTAASFKRGASKTYHAKKLMRELEDRE